MYLVPLALGLLFALDANASTKDESFDREAAAVALKGVDVTHCKTKNMPGGDGHVIVTFTPSGTASGAVVDRGPFAGPAAKCIAKEYKRAKVPPFKGDAVSVGKNFTLG
jgi:hypothetical protein